MIPLLLLFIACFSNVLCMPSFIETDSIVFPDDNDTSSLEITDKLNECLEEDKIEYNGECHTLLTTSGICPDNQWLVLDLVSATLPRPKIVGKCAQKNCSPPQYYWAEQKRCVYRNESFSLCPKGNEIDTDKFGDGYCRCIMSPVHGKDKSGACYPVYKQGPCPPDKVWTQVQGRAECYRDNCANTRARFPNKTVVPWSDNRCYAVDERGPCKQGHQVLVNVWTLRPECGDSIATLNLLNIPCSGADHFGQCAQGVKTPQSHFLTQVAQQAGKKRARKVSSDPK